jgi:hypothetical protein
MIRGRGINYDTGFFPGDKNSRTTFDMDTVRREMRVIAQDLHCTGVRVTGGDPERLSVAGRAAAEAGPGRVVLPVFVAFHALAAAYLEK